MESKVSADCGPSTTRWFGGRRGRGAALVVLMLLSLLAARHWGAAGQPVPAAAAPSGKPTGRGVVIGHVEGQPGDYLPHRPNPNLRGQPIHEAAGNSLANAHATSVGTIIYGRNGIAPDVAAVWCYPIDAFLQEGCLRAGAALPPHLEHDIDVFNHSWIGGEPPLGKQILRRVDELIDREGVVMCVGVNNGRQTPVPFLLASAYNVIAVGNAQGNSSGGYTRYEGEGRCKPDLVAEGGLTSFTTARVTGHVAQLIEAARAMADAADRAARPQVIKAVLMAAAIKPPEWRAEPGRPLDEHLGAGIVDAEASLSLLVAGPATPPLVADAGWDYRAIEAGDEAAVSYRFSVESPRVDAAFSLVWHRRVDGRVINDVFTHREMWLDTPSLANFDLRLYRRNAQGHDEPVAESLSGIDNVEHLYLATLPAGSYRIDVRRADALAGDWSYALAWRSQPSPPPPAPEESAPEPAAPETPVAP